MSKTIINSISDSNFVNTILGSNNYSDAMRKCGIKGNMILKTVHLKRRICRLNLDISHFDRNNYDKSNSRVFANEEVFVENSDYSSRFEIKQRLMKDFGVEYKCNSCGISEWKCRTGISKRISLELEHINGVNNDNRIENLELLCPNCHGMTDTFRSKNKKHKAVKNKCPDCETEINKNSTRCVFCTGKQVVINSRANGRPPLSVLLEEHSRMTMVAMGEKYKVSNNCVKNWIRKYRKFDLLE
jgi:DnaJ-class molecular chaperone